MKLEKIGALQFLTVFWIIITAGGAIFNTAENKSEFLFFDGCLVIIHFIKYPVKIRRLFLKVEGWAFLMLFFLVLSLIVNNDSKAILTYAHLLTEMILAFTTCAIVSNAQFLQVLVRTTIVLAVISLFFYFTPFMDSFGSSLPVIKFYSNEFKNAFVYISSDLIPDRNCSIFYEPGLFQVYLNLSLFIILNYPFKLNNKYLYIFILLVAIFTTKSTTGYIVTLVVLISQVFQGKYSLSGEFNKYLKFVIAVIFIGVIITSSFFISNLQEKFFQTKGNSYESRQNSTIIDLLIIKESPLTGKGLSNYSKIIENYGNQGLDTDSAPNSYTQIAANLGIPFLLIIVIRFVFYIKKLPLSSTNKFLMFGIFVVLFSTETFNLFPFFYVPVFMSFRMGGKSASEVKSKVVSMAKA